MPATDLPQPFYEDPWPARSREAARVLWDWHLALVRAGEAGLTVEDVGSLQARVERGEPPEVVPEAVWRPAYAACEAHGLPRAWLAEQLALLDRLPDGVRFETQADLNAFIGQTAVPHARLLARLADAAHSWQVRYVDELAKGFFLTGRLVRLPHDVAEGRVFIAEEALEAAGVTIEDLRVGGQGAALNRLVWKEVIRARDAFAQGMPLVNEIAPRFARGLKRWWLGGLEVLNEIERRDFDLWAEPIRLSRWHQLQVRYQARFGRATFRKR